MSGILMGPWDSHGNGNQLTSSMGMGMTWWKLEGMKTLHFPNSRHSELMVTEKRYWRKVFPVNFVTLKFRVT